MPGVIDFFLAKINKLQHHQSGIYRSQRTYLNAMGDPNGFGKDMNDTLAGVIHNAHQGNPFGAEAPSHVPLNSPAARNRSGKEASSGDAAPAGIETGGEAPLTRGTNVRRSEVKDVCH